MLDSTGELPAGWEVVRLGEILPPPRPKIAANSQSDLPYVGLEHIPANGLQPSSFGRFADMRSAGSQFQPGDVIYGRLRPYLNKVWCADRAGAASAEFIVFPSNQIIDGRFLALVLHHSRFVTFAKHAVAGDRPRIDVSDMAPDSIILPPKAEQLRIVQVVENLFIELDEAEAAFARAQAGLGEYRASLLHAACTGQLTAAWRTPRSNTAEDGPTLLRRILSERRAAWERAELARLHSPGKVAPVGRALKAKYQEPEEPAVEELPELPDGWTWASLGQLTHRITSGSRDWGNRYASEGPTLIRAQNIKNDFLVTTDLAHVQRPVGNGEARTLVSIGDLLITITGANVTKSAYVHDDIGEAFVSQHVGLCRLVLPEMSPFLHTALICGSIGRKQLLTAAYGAGKPGLNLLDLARLVLPLPPLSEQTEISKRVIDADGGISVHDATAAILRQSILYAAFTGRLVPQDPADAPAATLLARSRDAPATPPRARTKVPLKASAP